MTSPGVEALEGAQTVAVASSPTPQTGATILQCAAQSRNSPQQFYIQGGQVLIQGRVLFIMVKFTVYVYVCMSVTFWSSVAENQHSLQVVLGLEMAEECL